MIKLTAEQIGKLHDNKLDGFELVDCKVYPSGRKNGKDLNVVQLIFKLEPDYTKDIRDEEKLYSVHFDNYLAEYYDYNEQEAFEVKKIEEKTYSWMKK
jgi:hypothetical protein